MRHADIDLNDWMAEALNEAIQAKAKGEVPIGAVVVHGDTIIARAHNLVEQLKDASAHAELLALRQAAQALDRWRLGDCRLIVTLEPCAMCMAAARLYRVEEVVYGGSDQRFGAVDRTRDISRDPQWGPVPKLRGGIRADQAIALMQSFFEGLRK